MLNLFRTGTVFFILAGISFLLVALKYLLSDNGSEASSGALVATGMGCFVIGLALRSKNTKSANQGGPPTETRK